MIYKWKNLSKIEGARYIAVLLGVDRAVERGIELGEEILK